MKKFQKICSMLLCLMMSWTGLSAQQAQSYDKLWKQVEQAQKKSLPQTVIKLTDEIYRKGRAEQNAPQMLKAYLCRETYRQSLTPDSLYATLKDMENWAQQEPDLVNKSILHSLLATQYADLMRQNRRALTSRTELDVEEAPADVREWTAAQFISRIDGHSRAALQETEALLAASSEKYVPFTVTQDGSRFYGHDMYHLLSRRAVEAYGDMRGFDADSLMRRRTVDIYKAMIDTYSQRGAEDAVLLCTLDYWNWKLADGIDGNRPYQRVRMQQQQLQKAYLAALNSLIREYGDRQLCAEVYISKADFLRPGTEGRSVAEALKTCEEGLKRYSAYKRINELKNIREQILQPRLQVNTRESGYPGDSIDINVHFKNLSGFTLHLYATTLTEVPWMNHGINPDTYRKYARKLSSTHYTLKPMPGKDKLPEDLPYLASDTLFRMQLPEETGVYILQIVPDAGTTHTESRFLTTTRFKVLTLDLGGGQTEVVTLDARSGQPIAGATVSFYSITFVERDRKALAEVVTDDGGKAQLTWQEGIRGYVARKEKDAAMPPQQIYLSRPYDRREADEQTQITLLTDRALYRPGQTIHVKGIAYSQGKETARVLEGKEYEVALLDANRKQLAVQTVRTNDFGSFTADFVLPAACLNGRFTLRTENPRAIATFRVEEYKRPTFEIAFSPVTEAYKLGDRVVLKGNVKAFSGATVQNVPLAYTVVRQDPLAGYWARDEKPLLADTVKLDADGNFAIPLTLDAPADGRSFYIYKVEAVVTGEAGETQTTSYSLTASDKAYSFDIRMSQILCKEDSLWHTFNVRNNADVPQNMKGVYRIYPEEKPSADGVKPLLEGEFTANVQQDFSAWRTLPSGRYRLELSVSDSLGRTEKYGEAGECRFSLFSKTDKRPATFTDFFLYEENGYFDDRHPATFLVGTSHQDAYVLMDVFCNRKRIESRVLAWNDTIARMEFPYQASYGEGVTLLFSFVKNGELHERQIYLKKRQPERTLDVKWEVFRDRLRPGQEEEWKLVIKTPQGLPTVAELLALMYDASLDKLYKRDQRLQLLFSDNIYAAFRSASYPNSIYFSPYFPLKSWKVPGWAFDHFCSPYGMQVLEVRNDALSLKKNIMVRGTGSAQPQLMSAEAGQTVEVKYVPVAVEESAAADDVLFEEEITAADGNSLTPVDGLRTNFAETAFFYPQLRTNEQGEIAFAFTMPQSLTRWNFCGYAHTREMLTGRLDASVVTAKEFMLTPNMPRFARVGDRTQIAATIANLTGKAVKGTATLTLFDPVTEKVIATRRKKFAAEAGRNVAVTFSFDVTDRCSVLGVRLVADGGSFSDGEQHLLPVLSNKEYITETVAMPIRGGQTRTFALDSLFNRNSRTATDRRLTVEFTGNPAWYAVQALPTLSQPTTDNAIAWAAAYYANSLAGFIAHSQPRIQAVIESWKAAGGTKETFLSQLEKNQEVKNILLSESPWLMEATTEREQQARIATLFDVNQQNNRRLSALTKLKELQREDGSWSWYKGMSGSRSITAYVTELLVRLPLLTQEVADADVTAMRQQAFDFLHRQALEEYRNLLKYEKSGGKVTVNSEAAMEYLYLIALSGEKVPEASQAAYDYFLARVKNNLTDDTMVRKAQSAIILKAAGRATEATDFIASLKEHLVQTDELGAHFAFHANPYMWGMMPVPAHVAVMEALQQAGGNEALVEEMKLWLLKQKQTTSWNSPVATADAIYALLCQGSNLLESRGDVRISLGKTVIEISSPAEAAVPGLGYVKETFTEGSREVKTKSVTVEKRDEGIAWGAVYAQYLSPMSDVKQHGGELNIEKKLYVERVSADGSKSLQPVAEGTALAIGDKIVSRLTIRLDRAMDFVQLKDQRGACFEPIGALSGYCWNNGFGYYTEVEDAATNFFFDHLGKGVYVLEHSYRIARGGTYETGLATVQCAYAPEYASHSAGGQVTVE